jgi:hypothetical protein
MEVDYDIGNANAVVDAIAAKVLVPMIDFEYAQRAPKEQIERLRAFLTSAFLATANLTNQPLNHIHHILAAGSIPHVEATVIARVNV